MIPYIHYPSCCTINTWASIASNPLFEYFNEKKNIVKITCARCRHWSSAIICLRLAKAAARSICPIAWLPSGLAGADGLGAAGLPTGGLGGAPGFAATGGGFGLFATGGGGPRAIELEGLELAGVLSVEPLVALGAFFHGVADPLDGAIPGKTDTGFADESAATDLIGTLATAVGAGGAGGAAGAEGGG